jgi:hypothetical protein
MATPFFEVLQLVEQITRWFTRNAWEVSLIGGNTLCTVAGGAGLHALGHGVRLILDDRLSMHM